MFSPIKKYQQGGSNQEQLMQQIAQMLQQQVPPQKIMQQLQQMGIQPQQAQQLIQQVAQSMQQPQMQQGGDFDVDNVNPYLSDKDQDNQMMKGGVHRMPNGTMMQRMQSGGSLVDFLAKKGQKFDMNSRKELASRMGISNYKGTAEQNLRLLSYLDDNPFKKPMLPNGFNQFVQASRPEPMPPIDAKTMSFLKASRQDAIDPDTQAFLKAAGAKFMYGGMKKWSY